VGQLDNVSGNSRVVVLNPEGRSSVVVVCEHASSYIPPEFNDLGLSGDALQSHAAWDPGAMSVAKSLSLHLDATLVASDVSRLVYDCNRPPDAPDAMPARSEVFDVPGNANLTSAQRQERIAEFYDPFRVGLADAIATKTAPIVVTVHSFTPVFDGQRRAVEIGVLHDTDDRLANAMLEIAPSHLAFNVQRNAPYGPEHGVTHTLKEHAIAAGHLNVMLEVRNDLLQSQAQQDMMAEMIAQWLTAALADLSVTEGVACQA
jgi:predicted N-formylglutamate amidohydrolase